MLACSFIEGILVEDDLKLIEVNWYWILTNNDSRIVFDSLNLLEPLVLSNVYRCVAFSWIGVKNLLYENSAVIANKLRNRVISV